MFFNHGEHNMTIAAKLAAYAIRAFREESFPDNVRVMAVQAIIDQYGLQIGGSEFSWSKAILNYTRKYTGTGNSSVTRYGDKLPPIQAAFLNSSFSHAQDFDDSHQEAQTHPGSVVIPAAIALAEDLNLSGEVTLRAIIIGMEIMLRLAHSLCPACIEGGHHTPPTIGPFGSAIACGLLLNLTEKQLTNALGICGSYAGGLVEYTHAGGSVKRIHTALGARAGLEAALLAKEGLTGPDTVIEGKKGMWAIFGRDNALPERLFDKIGKRYMLSTLMFKPYNCCYLIHPAIQLFLELCEKNNISSHQIKSVTVGFSQFSISHAGKIIIPKDELGAQFSTSFTLALALIKEPPSMYSYNKNSLFDPEILTLAKKISTYEDAKAQAEFPKKNGCIIHIYTNDETIFSARITDPKGSPDNLLTSEDVKEKFLKNTIPVINKDKALALYQALENFSSFLHIKTLIQTCYTQGIKAKL
jgi:2-methylcitrate dehydratase PrpD